MEQTEKLASLIKEALLATEIANKQQEQALTALKRLSNICNKCDSLAREMGLMINWSDGTFKPFK